MNMKINSLESEDRDQETGGGVYEQSVRDAVCLQLVCAELQRARAKHPRPHYNAHHSYAVIKEELDEFWEEVREHEPAPELLLKELLHVGAMSLRAISDVVAPQFEDLDWLRIQLERLGDRNGFATESVVRLEDRVPESLSATLLSAAEAANQSDWSTLVYLGGALEREARLQWLNARSSLDGVVKGN